MSEMTVVIKAPTPFDNDVYEYIDQMEFDSPNWKRTSIRLPKQYAQVIGDFVDGTHIPEYKTVSALIMHGHSRLQSEFENQLLELEDKYPKATNESKFAASNLTERSRCLHYEFPSSGEDLSQPKSYMIQLKREGRIKQQSRWLGLTKAAMLRHLILLGLVETEYGVDSVWFDDLLEIKTGFEKYIKKGRVPHVMLIHSSGAIGSRTPLDN